MKELKTIKEKPILFKTPMVKAILQGEKTHTRREIKLPESEFPANWIAKFENGKACFYNSTNDREFSVKCPWQIGQVLWIKETYNSYNENVYGLRDKEVYLYKADGDDRNSKWKSSLFMPKGACRLKLKVIDIRLQKLNEISEEDAISEGIVKFTKDNTVYKYGIEGWHWSAHTAKGKDLFMQPSAYEAFKLLWASIKGQNSWKENPYVWVIEFKKI